MSSIRWRAKSQPLHKRRGAVSGFLFAVLGPVVAFATDYAISVVRFEVRVIEEHSHEFVAFVAALFLGPSVERRSSIVDTGDHVFELIVSGDRFDFDCNRAVSDASGAPAIRCLARRPESEFDRMGQRLEHRPRPFDPEFSIRFCIRCHFGPPQLVVCTYKSEPGLVSRELEVERHVRKVSRDSSLRSE